MGTGERVLHWVATLFIPVLLFFLAPIWGGILEEKKSLEYMIIGEDELLDSDVLLDYWPDIEIKNSDESISDVFYTAIKITNAGKVPIRSDDFEGPVKFEFKEKEEILKTKIVISSPESLPASASFENGQLVIDPLLMNPDDWFVVAVLSGQKLEITKAIARIVGVENIKEREIPRHHGLALKIVEPADRANVTKETLVLNISTYSLIIIAFISAFSAFFFYFKFDDSEDSRESFIYIVMGFNAYVIAIFSTIMIPKSYFVSESESWFSYVFAFGVLLFSGSLFYWLRKKLILSK
ncbi:hypothetical protein [Marinobacterium stanieri]|uniref:Uncharacterized protein n=1 Tax=Marinobacterium stanieri TaxID=49186 RepID=A0A1N6W6T8_9GAMM|nr:hypothetical protein [Marinobacterium stanieri]SIQ85666.1 hypothetical protein SAMN05421647_1108 [Marinobacterium stanieri]